MHLHSGFPLVAMLCLGSAQPAFSADMPVKAPVAPAAVVAYGWGGFYVGGNVGMAWFEKSATELVAFELVVNPPNSLHDNSFTGGVQAGYNWQLNQWLVGVEGDINWTNIDKTIVARGSPPVEDDDILRGKVRWFGTIRGRLGYARSNWLLYVTGGAAVARLTNEYGDTDSGVLDPNDGTSVTKTRWGWTVGGGLEYALARRWSVKFEYLYLDFGTFTATPITPGEPGVVEFKDRIHVARFGVNYGF